MHVALLAALEAVTPAPPRAARSELSLPFVLRPWAPPNLVRFDAAHAVVQQRRTTVATLTAGGRVAPDLGVYFRGAAVIEAKGGPSADTALGNPALFALYAPAIAETVRLPVFVAVVFPLGDGGGNRPELGARDAMTAAGRARQAMDNALFAPNYATFAVGVGIGHVARWITVQMEATAFQLFRTRGGALDGDTTSRRARTSGTRSGASSMRTSRCTSSGGSRHHLRCSPTSPRAIR